jgi:serine/threonine protein kinase
MALDPSKASNHFAAHPAPYDDDPTAEIEAPITCELDDQHMAGLQPYVAPGAAGAAEPAQGVGPADAAPGIGATLRGRYVLEEIVGTGGFSTVYRARDLRRDDEDPQGCQVAIKLLRPECAGSQSATLRLKREFRQLRLLAHPGIVRLFDLDCHEGWWFEVMELLRGRTLSSLLRERNGEPLPLAEAMAVLRGCAEALEHAHSRGVVHGDVKPANVFVRETGDVCVLDFGSVPLSGEEDTDPKRVGTVRYSSPEVLRGLQATPADDVYSLACIALELITGRSLSTTTDADGARPDLTGLPPVQTNALGAALAGERVARPASPQAFFEQLSAPAEAAVEPPAAARAMDPPAATPDLLNAPSEPAARRRYQAFPPRLWLGVLLVTVAIAALAWLRVVATSEGRAGTSNQASTMASLESAPTAAPVTGPDAATVAEEPAASPASGQEAGAIDEAVPSAASALSPPLQGASVTPASTISFRAPSMTVSRLANAAAVELWREGRASGRSRIGWEISEDSASAGRDFDGPLSGEEVFADGQSIRVLFVPIRGDADGRSDRSFTVSLRPLEARTGLGQQPSIRVTILSPEDMVAQAGGG